jgi:putative transposase
MPYGLKRFQKAEALHFITFRCFHRLPLFEAPVTRGVFETVLEQVRARHEARIYGQVAQASVSASHSEQMICAPFIAALSR